MVSLPNRRSPRTAFVLSGGGNLGALQVGMLRALTEQGIAADVVIGCSVGALNGVVYATQGDLGAVRRMEKFWTVIDSPKLMPPSLIPSAVQMLRRGKSLYDNDGLRDSLEELLEDKREFEDLAVPFECVATHVDTAVERWFNKGELVQPILASSALPAVFPPVVIDGERYVDGGVVDYVPVSRAVELGCTSIYVLHTGSHGKPDPEVRRPIDGAILAYWLARNSRFARDLTAVPEGTETIVLPPGARPELRYDDFSQSRTLMDQGYENTINFLDQRAEELEERRVARSLRTRIARIRRSAIRRNRSLAEQAALDPEGAIHVNEETLLDDGEGDERVSAGASPESGTNDEE